MQPELLLSGQLCIAVSGARIALLGLDEACCESLCCCMLQQQQRVDLQAKHRLRRHKARSLSTHTFRLLWRSVVRLAWDSEMRVMRVTFQTWKISSCASLTGATKLCSPDIIHTVLLIDVCPWMQDDLKQLLGMLVTSTEVLNVSVDFATDASSAYLSSLLIKFFVHLPVIIDIIVQLLYLL